MTDYASHLRDATFHAQAARRSLENASALAPSERDHDVILGASVILGKIGGLARVMRHRHERHAKREVES